MWAHRLNLGTNSGKVPTEAQPLNREDFFRAIRRLMKKVNFYDLFYDLFQGDKKVNEKGHKNCLWFMVIQTIDVFSLPYGMLGFFASNFFFQNAKSENWKWSCFVFLKTINFLFVFLHDQIIDSGLFLGFRYLSYQSMFDAKFSLLIFFRFSNFQKEHCFFVLNRSITL